MRSKCTTRNRQPIVHFPDDDSDMDVVSDSERKKKKLDIEELTSECEPERCKDPQPFHQIPIKLSDGRLVKASFTHLDDPVIPPWSVFYRPETAADDVVNIKINGGTKEQDTGRKNDSPKNSDNEKDVDHLWSELQGLGRLPASPFPSR